jgi:4-alpha-glucanotransferase
VPAGAETATAGKWAAGPGEDFLNEVARRFPSLPFIAEDLGVITGDVIALRDGFELPGMRVFQFGFGKSPDEYHMPHRYVKNCVAYPGTHDNETLSGWLSGSSRGKRRPLRHVGRARRQVRRYTGCRACGREKIRSAVLEALMRSEAAWVIIPMQDIIGLGNEGRMNTPGTARGNWTWRMAEGELSNSIREELRAMTTECGRAKNGISGHA